MVKTMIVKEFDTNKGLYFFEFEDDVETEYHKHPAIEVIIAKYGTFTLWNGLEGFSNLKFAIIGANQKHRLCAKNCGLKVFMFEHHNKQINDCLTFAKIDLKNGFFIESLYEKAHKTIDVILQQTMKGSFATEYDRRIRTVIDFLNTNTYEHSITIKKLQSVTNLSESRLSHLFKTNVGISLKKYLVWVKLKSAIKEHLNNKEDLFYALINSGFYDQPHFSKSFKSMLGIKPSKAYNSRTVQVLPVNPS
ncbi:MAG: helix-turn-helix transcriptional regulator [Bacteroidetes bacterium]|nr:MAG: helix-turn-helix transcriptional regulator [Bacteroidota bacterium]